MVEPDAGMHFKKGFTDSEAHQVANHIKGRHTIIHYWCICNYASITKSITVAIAIIM